MIAAPLDTDLLSTIVLAAAIAVVIVVAAAPGWLPLLAALAAWLACWHRTAVYHRHRYQHARCHARATRAHRARVAVARLRMVRLYIKTTPATTPDTAPRMRHA